MSPMVLFLLSGSAWELDESIRPTTCITSVNSRPQLGKRGLRHQVYDAVDFLDSTRGIGGYGMDVIDMISKIPDQEIISNDSHAPSYLKGNESN